MFPAYAGMDPIWTPWGVFPSGVPRLRGDGPPDDTWGAHWRGCSPPTRGWTASWDRSGGCPRVFPAYAGMDPRVLSPRRFILRVPRLRGDGPVRSSNLAKDLPCSPPTRGWTGGYLVDGHLDPVFPAYAGMDRGTGYRCPIQARVPRLRGDGPQGVKGEGRFGACSPPTRGWTGGGRAEDGQRAVFPAYAGMDRRLDARRVTLPRVPRLRGDGPVTLPGLPFVVVCSPPTRGWTSREPRRPGRSGVFPAYAGMDR